MNIVERCIVSVGIVVVCGSLSLLLYRLAEKFQLEAHMVRQFLISQGVQLP